MNDIKIFTHIFYTNHLGEPAGLKSSRLICLNEAWSEWEQLQLHGWTEASHKFG